MTELRDILEIDNGAQFVDVDLHVHTYGGSHDVSDATLTPENVVDSAVRQGLHVIAITDHNSAVNAQAAVDHASSNHPGDILVLPGVEITTSHGHLLVYARPERAGDLEKLLINVDLRGERGAEDTHSPKSMSDVIDEADKLGALCVAAHIDRQRTGFEAFASGFQNWKKDILTSPGLYGLEADSDDALDWYSDRDEGSAGAERKKLLAARRASEVLRSRQHLAHVRGSDAHSMAQFEQSGRDRPWTRMKLNSLSFDAVRLALIDPTARVVARTMIPEAVPYVVGVDFTGGFLHGEKIHFSKNLNSFIGGRGTGKSTAIRAVAYALGANDEFEDLDNCPDAVTVWCQGANGVHYRYDRTRNGSLVVRAREDGSIADVPPDSFRVEYFGQGELADVARDPLHRPELLQEFLDRHTDLRDLQEKESSILPRLRENAARVVPLEVASSRLPEKRKLLKEIAKKLALAEEGNLREVVSQQNKLAAEKAVREALDRVVSEYSRGYSLAPLRKDFKLIRTNSGECTTEPESVAAMKAVEQVMADANAEITRHERDLQAHLKSTAEKLTQQIKVLRRSHQHMSAEVAKTLADLKSRGLATTIPGLEANLRQKTSVVGEINTIEQKADDLKTVRAERVGLLADLTAVRTELTNRRKILLKKVNQSLAAIIEDYLVFIKYDDAGITKTFEEFLQTVMHGSYMPDDVIAAICTKITPIGLTELIRDEDADGVERALELSSGWGVKLIERLSEWETHLALQELNKPAKPVIVVRTRTTPPRELAVDQLSDGQRHTILLTVAMLSDSNVPLVIDQPEDDLDNAFIFSSVVQTLRGVKERRQVILVTHNPNIAVLGDSELILPMYRDDYVGRSQSRGSIDAASTQKCVVEILEGGYGAFLRRKEMYGH